MCDIKKELTVGQKLGCTAFPLEIVYNDGKNKYIEYSDGYWEKHDFESNGKLIRLEKSDGIWVKWERDTNGKQISYEDSNGFWSKREYDSNGEVIYFESSKGDLIDNRPKVELTLKDIADKFGIPLSQLRVKE